MTVVEEVLAGTFLRRGIEDRQRDLIYSVYMCDALTLESQDDISARHQTEKKKLFTAAT